MTNKTPLSESPQVQKEQESRGEGVVQSLHCVHGRVMDICDKCNGVIPETLPASEHSTREGQKERQHILASAGYWFRGSRKAQSDGLHAESVMCMENAYNHVENALAACNDFIRDYANGVLMRDGKTYGQRARELLSLTGGSSPASDSPQSPKVHSIQDDFEHFLGYSNLGGESEDIRAKLFLAFEAAWPTPCKPPQTQGLPVHSDKQLEAVRRDAWEEGIRLARSYGDNICHLHGEQKEQQFRQFLKNLPAAMGDTQEDKKA